MMMSLSLIKRISFTIALSLYLSTLEALLPHPLFLRYGFAYISLLVLSDVLTFKEFLVSLLFKALISALFSLTLFSPMFLLSLCSSLVSGVIIWSLRKVKYISHLGVSILSSLAANGTQLYLISILLYGKFTLFLTPIVLFVGLISSIVVGIISNNENDRIHTLFKNIDTIEKSNKENFTYSFKGKTIGKIFISLFLMVLMIFISSFFMPRGEVIFEHGFLKLTKDALNLAIKRSIVIATLVLLSLLISLISIIKLKKGNNNKFGYVWNYFLYFITTQKK